MINLEGVAKVPFGTGDRGGVLGVGLGLTYAPQTVKGDVTEGSQTVTGFGLATSFSVFW